MKNLHLLRVVAFAVCLMAGGMMANAQEKEPYVVFSDNNETLTFYYDTKKADRGGIEIPTEYGNPNYKTVKTAVIDASYAGYHPTNTSYMFSCCLALTAIKGIENLKTDKVTFMYSMFDKCSSLTSLDLSHFNTEKVNDMSFMFDECSSLKSIDLSSFNTKKVTSMCAMFRKCSSLTSLDLGNFNTAKVRDISYMFDNCSALTAIYATEEEWSTASMRDGYDMFRGCTSLVGGNGTAYDASHTDAEYARIDKPGQPGYLTDKNSSGIRGVAADSNTDNRQWYTLDGRRVTGEPDSRGIYVTDGRKVVRR